MAPKELHSDLKLLDHYVNSTYRKVGRQVVDGMFEHIHVFDDYSKVRKYQYKNAKWEFVSIIHVDDVTDDESDTI